MLVLGVDPGVTTGLCLYNPYEDEVLYAVDTKDILYLVKIVSKRHPDPLVPLHIVIENFIGNGRRDANIVTAIKHLGFAEHFGRLHRIPVTLQPPQARKAFLAKAKKISPPGHHHHDACAHVLAYCHFRQTLVEKERPLYEQWRDIVEEMSGLRASPANKRVLGKPVKQRRLTPILQGLRDASKPITVQTAGANKGEQE